MMEAVLEVVSYCLYACLQGIFLFIFICFLVRWYRSFTHVSIINKLPGLRVKFYRVFGHIDVALKYKLRNYPQPIHVYDFQFHNAYNILFKQGITHVWQFLFPFVTVYKAEIVEGILNQSTELKKAWFYKFLHPWLGTGLLTSYDEKWRRRRKLLTPAFHFDILRDFLPVFNKQAKILVDVLDQHTKDEYADIVKPITFCSLDIICESILGKELHSQTDPKHPYVQTLHDVADSITERMHRPYLWPDCLLPLTPFGRKFIKNKNILHDFTNQLIAERKEIKLRNKTTVTAKFIDDVREESVFNKKKKALLDLLLDEHIENNSISEEGIREEVDTFTFEGHDTTSMAMSWTLYLLGLHPWIQEKVHNELDAIFDEDDRDATEEDLKRMKYLECVVKETLRLYPSVPVFGREVREDLNICGYTVPKGSTCVIQSYLLHRDPDHFPNPEKFDPDRFLPEKSTGRHPFSYVPFSAGPRNCIGQRFAMMEEKTILSFMLRRYKVRSLDPRDQVHVLDELVLRPYKGLRIQIRKRKDNFSFDSIYYRP